MLARSPTAATWLSENDYSSRLIENDVVIATKHRICGTWDGFIEQSVVPHRSKSARHMLERRDTREEAQAACEAFIEGIRRRDAAFAASDAGALGREAIQTKLPPDYEAGFTSCAGR